MKFKILFFLLILAVMSFAPVYAETNTGEGVTLPLTRDSIQSKIEILKAKQGIDEASKNRELNWYKLADENIANMQWYEYLADSYQKLLSERVQKQDKKPTSERKIQQKFNVPADLLTGEVLESQTVQVKQELRSVNDSISKLETEFNQLSIRPESLREETLIASQDQEKAMADIQVTLRPNENKYEYEAHKIYLQTLINTLSAELKKNELEAEVIPIQIQRNKEAREELAEEKAYLLRKLDEFEKLLEKQSLEKAEQLQKELIKAEAETEDKYPIVQSMIRNNIQWNLDLQNVISSTSRHNQSIDAMDAYKQVVSDYHKNAEKMIKLAGLSPALGRVLREQRRNLANSKLKYLDKVNIQEEANLISLAQFKVEERQNQLVNLQQEADRLAAKLQQATKMTEQEEQDVRRQILTLLNSEDHVLSELNGLRY